MVVGGRVKMKGSGRLQKQRHRRWRRSRGWGKCDILCGGGGGRVKMKGGGRLQTSVTEGGLVEEVGVGVNEKGVCRVQSLMTSVVNFTNRLAKGTGGGGVHCPPSPLRPCSKSLFALRHGPVAAPLNLVLAGAWFFFFSRC